MPYADGMNLTEFVRYGFGDQLTREQKVAKCMIEAGTIMKVITVKTIQRFEVKGRRQLTLPDEGEGWGDFNDDATTESDYPHPWAEGKYRYYKNWKAEKSYGDAAGGGGIKAVLNAKMLPSLTAFTYWFNFRYFNNRKTGSSVGIERKDKCFVGLRPRLATAGLGSGSPWQIPADMYRNLGGLDLTVGAANLGANTSKLFKEIEKALYRLGRPDGDGCVIHVGIELQTTMAMGIRAMGAASGWSMQRDNYGTEFMAYRKARVEVAGALPPDSTTFIQDEVLTGYEPQDGSAWKQLDASGGWYDPNTKVPYGNYGSVFITKTDPEGLWIEQFYPMEPTDPRLLQDDITYQTTLYNFFGLVQKDNRSVMQLAGIKVTDNSAVA